MPVAKKAKKKAEHKACDKIIKKNKTNTSVKQKMAALIRQANK